MDVGNTGFHAEIAGVGIDTSGVQETSHEDKKNEYEDEDTTKIADKDIPEEDVHHTHLTSPT